MSDDSQKKAEIEEFLASVLYHSEPLLLAEKDTVNSLGKTESGAKRDESNPDYELKRIIQNVLMSNLTELQNMLPSHTHIKIEDVLLPEDMPAEAKASFTVPGKQYTKPDLCFMVTYEEEVHYVSIEIKSTNNDTIPGSSVQQVDPNQLVIFVRKGKNYQVCTGKYLHSIDTNVPFPDRSPRVNVSFNNLHSINSSYRVLDEGLGTISYESLPPMEDRLLLVEDWRKVLIQRWMDVIFGEPSSKAWFNNVLRMFVSVLLKKYDELDGTEKSRLKESLSPSND